MVRTIVLKIGPGQPVQQVQLGSATHPVRFLYKIKLHFQLNKLRLNRPIFDSIDESN